jgi:hypothetical protein
MIQTSRVLNVEAEKIGDVGETADHLETFYGFTDIFLKDAGYYSLKHFKFHLVILFLTPAIFVISYNSLNTPFLSTLAIDQCYIIIILCVVNKK